MIDHERRAVRILAGICRRIIRDKPELIEQLRHEQEGEHTDDQPEPFARKQPATTTSLRTAAAAENR